MCQLFAQWVTYEMDRTADATFLIVTQSGATGEKSFITLQNILAEFVTIGSATISVYNVTSLSGG